MQSILQNELLLPLLAGIGIAVSAGILGCFVIWKRMAYFGDAVSHSALLGIALSILVAIEVDIAIIMVCAIFALILALLQQNRFFTTDSILGILAHASLGVGMAIVGVSGGENIDIHHFLFGDILKVNLQNVQIICASAFVIALLIYKNWQSLCILTICPDLAKSEGVNPVRLELLLILLIAIFVGLAIKIFGVLLVTSMLIIPPACARIFSSSPLAMVFSSIFFAIISVVLGVMLTNNLHIESGPAIVVCSSFILFMMSLSCLFRAKS